MSRKSHVFVLLAYKESEYLEECIHSLKNQNREGKIVVATSTPNAYIQNICDKHQLKLVDKKSAYPHYSAGIGQDFDFALQVGIDEKAEYVTIAHQDDTYHKDYVKRILDEVKEDTIIAFTNYHEERESGVQWINTNLRVKRILLFPLRSSTLAGKKWVRRRVLSFGNPICCPSVTFRAEMVTTPLFSNEFKSNVDWFAWEQLSRKKGRFTYVPEDLMMHRVHEESTTTEIIQQNIRTKEDYKMFTFFWPKRIAKCLAGVYKKSEASNEIKK